MSVFDSFIFISYARKDSEFVNKIINAFRLQNFNIWYDVNGLSGGADYNDVIATQIKNCSVFISFMSKNYDDSDFCRKELLYAEKYKKEVFIAFIDNIKEEELSAGIEMHISSRQAIFRKDFSSDDDFIKKICNEPIVVKYKIRSSTPQTAPCNPQTKDITGIDIFGGECFSYVYSGESVDGKRHGYGKCTWNDGDVYKGEWLNDKTNGTGRMIYADDTIYEGEWKDGKENGYGKMLLPYGSMYNGEFKDGFFHGRGKLTYCTNQVYEGEWKDGKRNGIGKMTYAANLVYDGEWKDDMRHGKGKLTLYEDYSDPEVYDGEWQNDKRHGIGKYYSYGDTYEGEWFNDNITGKGKMTYFNGSVYTGEWKNGEQHGRGRLTKPDGTYENCFYINGEKQ